MSGGKIFKVGRVRVVAHAQFGALGPRARRNLLTIASREKRMRK